MESQDKKTEARACHHSLMRRYFWHKSASAELKIRARCQLKRRLLLRKKRLAKQRGTHPKDRKADLAAWTVLIPILWFLGSIVFYLVYGIYEYWIWICLGGFVGSTLPWSKLLLIKLFQGREKGKETIIYSLFWFLIQSLIFIMIAYPSTISNSIKITPISFLTLLGSWFLIETLMQAKDGLEYDDLKKRIEERMGTIEEKIKSGK